MNCLSFVRELGIAAFEEVTNMLPAAICMTASNLSPGVGTVVHVATSALSMKRAFDESWKQTWTWDRVKEVSYYAGVGIFSACQVLHPCAKVDLALATIAVGAGVTKLLGGCQQIRKGLQDESLDSDTKSQVVARGLVLTGVGSFSLTIGIGKFYKGIRSFSPFKYNYRYRELVSSQEPSSVAIRGVPLFSSTIYGGGEVDEDLAKETLATIQAGAAHGVCFSEEGMLPWAPRGTCSARALDFLARHINECSLTDGSFAQQTCCIEKFGPFYERGSVFQSRQAAFDTIQVDRRNASISAEDLKTAKMASLAALHGMNLRPMTQESLELGGLTRSVYASCLSRSEINQVSKATDGLIGTKTVRDWWCCLDSTDSSIHPNEQEIIDKFNELPLGRYLIRGILPEDNHKQETHGHSMALVKSNQGNFFFDPAGGAVAIVRNLGRSGAAKILAEHIWYTGIRIYEASCGENGCKNLAPIP